MIFCHGWIWLRDLVRALFLIACLSQRHTRRDEHDWCERQGVERDADCILQNFDIAIKTRKGLKKKHVDESARLKPCASLLKKNCSQMLGTAQPCSVRPCKVKAGSGAYDVFVFLNKKGPQHIPRVRVGKSWRSDTVRLSMSEGFASECQWRGHGVFVQSCCVSESDGVELPELCHSELLWREIRRAG